MEFKKKISVRLSTSKFCNKQHYIIYINNVPLDTILDIEYPEENLKGLVPTIMSWISSERERNLILNRYNSYKEAVVLPILMCPDDCDLWCTVIVAEVLRDGDNVIWSRIGIDRSTQEELMEFLEHIGLRVEWLEKIPKMIFDRESYYKELDKIYAKEDV